MCAVSVCPRVCQISNSAHHGSYWAGTNLSQRRRINGEFLDSLGHTIVFHYEGLQSKLPPPSHFSPVPETGKEGGALFLPCFWHVFATTLAYLDHFWGHDMFRLSVSFIHFDLPGWYYGMHSICPFIPWPIYLDCPPIHLKEVGRFGILFWLSLEYVRGKWVSQSSS